MMYQVQILKFHLSLNSINRDALTPDQQRLQLDKKAQQKMELRDNETPEQRRERLDLDKESHKQARVSESAEAYEERNRKKSECYKKQKGKL